MGKSRKGAKHTSSTDAAEVAIAVDAGDAKQPAKTNSKALYLFGLLGIGAAAAYLSHRAVFAPANSVATASDDWIASSACNTSIWHFDQKLPLNDIWSNKMQLVLTPEKSRDPILKSNLTQGSYRVARLFDESRKEAICKYGCNYIDFVLAYPGFQIKLSEKLAGNRKASYVADENSFRLDLVTLNLSDPLIKRAILHEMWHAYKTLVHTKKQDPTKLKITLKNHPGYPCQRNAADVMRRIRALQSAIDVGDNHILHDLVDLLQREKIHAISEKENKRLTQYKEAAESYIPNYHAGKLNVDNFKRIEKELNAAKAKGKKYKHTFKRGAHELVIYVDFYEKTADGGAILRGHATPDTNDKVTALINDTKYRKYNLAHDLHAEGGQDGEEDNIFIEHDARIAENGEAVNAVFYPERLKFHNCEYNEAFPAATAAPAMTM